MPQNMEHQSGLYGQDPAGASAWYQPAAPRPEPAASPRRDMTDGQRRRHRRTKAVTLTLCALLVCAAAAVVVLNSSLLQRIQDLQTAEDRLYGGAGTDFDFSFGSDSDIYGALPGTEYDDYKEYFENYYSSTNEIGLPAAPTGTGVTLKLNTPRGEKLSLQEVYDKVSPAVVGITTYIDKLEYSWGTGVVFDADAGYIVTNTHILQGCDGAKVILTDGRELEARLVGADEASDIAVLQVEDKGETLTAAEFGRSASLRVGDEVSAIGNPLSQAYTGTMTNGIISAIDRDVTYGGHSMTLLQTNAALNEGNSGGPLINGEGQVIGITNMKIMSGYFTTVEGIGFAIPSAVVKRIADQLIENGMIPGEPTIGIVAGAVGAEARALYDLPAGVYVSEVSEGSDALEKGLQVGDVITKVNGEAVSTVEQVNLMKEDMEVGDGLTLTVFRDGDTFELEVELVDKADIK